MQRHLGRDLPFCASASLTESGVGCGGGDTECEALKNEAEQEGEKKEWGGEKTRQAAVFVSGGERAAIETELRPRVQSQWDDAPVVMVILRSWWCGR